MDLIQIKLWDNRTEIIDTGPIYDNSSKSLRGGKVGGFALDAANIRWSSLSYRSFENSVSGNYDVFTFRCGSKYPLKSGPASATTTTTTTSTEITIGIV